MQQAYNPQTGEMLFLVNNQWVKPQQEALNPKTNERAFLVGNEWQVVPSSAFEATAQPEPTPESQSVFRSVADPFLKAGAGVVMGVRMIADAFGAGSETSQTLKGAEDWIAALYSAQSQRDSKKVAQIIDAAKDKGVWDQVKAGFSAFLEAPVDIVAQGLGTAAPAILASLATTVVGAPAAVTTAAGLGIGALMGAGTVKGAIYDAVKEELAKTSMPTDEIEKRAQLAQEYGGANLDQILMGSAIGGLSARTGLESSIAKAAAARIAGKTAVAEAAEAATRQQVAKETAEAAARGPLLQGARTAAVESGTEFLQGGQEQLARNLALQREGFDVPTSRGVVAQGTLEALAGAPLGGAFGAREAVVARQEQERLDQLRALVNPPPPDPSLDPDDQTQQLATWYEQSVTPELAGVMAREMTALRSAAEQQAAAAGLTLPPLTQAAEGTDQVISVDPERVRMLEDALLANGQKPAIARLRAILLATKEAYDDWFAEQDAEQGGEVKEATAPKPNPLRVEELIDALVEAGVPLEEAKKLALTKATQEAAQGVTNVRGPVTPAGGEGVRVAGKPPAGAPTGGAGVSEAAGVVSPATDAGLPDGRKETAPGTLKQQANQWDQQNRLDRTGAWFEGAKSNEDAVAGFNAALQNGGDTLPAHGMAKESTLVGAIRNLLNVLENGLDPSRRGGRLDYAPLVTQPGSAAAMVSTTPGGNAYSDGPFILVARPGQEFEGKLEGLGAILVNQANADIVPALRAEVQAIRPDVLVEPYSNAGEIAKQLTGAPSGTQTPQTVEAKEKRPAAAAKTAAAKPAATAKPEKPLGVFALADKLANDAFTNLDQYKGSDQYEKLENAVSELRFALQTELENRGAKTGALAPTLARFDKKVAELRRDAVSRNPTLDPKDMGKRFADAAFDQRGEYGGLEETIDSYRDNLRDTLNEYKAGAFADDVALRAFDARVEELRKGEKPAPKKRGRPARSSAESASEFKKLLLRGRGRPALPPEERAARAKARTGVRAQANRDARRLKQVALDLTTQDKDRRRDALFTLLDIVKTSQSTPRLNQARNMLKANTTEAERAELEKGYGDWKDKQAEIAAFEADQREQQKATRLTPEEKKQKQEEAERARDKRRVEQEQNKLDALEAKASRNWRSQTVDVAAAAERRAVQTLKIKRQLEDKINKQKQKIADLGKRLAAFRQNKPVDEAKLLLKEKEYKLEQLKLKVFEDKLIDWDADWEQGTKVRSLEDAAQEIRALQPKRAAKKSMTFEQQLAAARNIESNLKGRDAEGDDGAVVEQVAGARGRRATEDEAGTNDIAIADLFDSQVEGEVEEGVEAEQPAGEAKVKKPAGEKKKRKAAAKKPVEEPKQLTPQEQYASLVENLPGAPAFDTLSEGAQKQITDLAERNQLNLAAINRIVSEEAPKFSQTPNVDKADVRFSKFTTAGQAAAHVARTGNAFQRALARRLSGLKILQNTKFVVLEPGDPPPRELKGDPGWGTARGVFIPSTNTIYVRSAADPLQGANNITVLHEALHAALQAKIAAGRQRLKAYRDAILRGQPVSGFATEVESLFIDLARIARRAETHFRALEDMPEELLLTVAGTQNERTGKYDIFSNLDEFLSYGMSDPVFQDFLKTVPMEGTTGFSRFVKAILRFLGMASNDQSALSRLIDATDKLIAVPGKFVRSQQAAFAQAAAAPTPPTPPAANVAAKAKAKKQKVDATLQKVLRSHSSSPTFMDGVRQLINERKSDLLLDVLTSKFASFKGSALRQLLPTLQTETLVDWASRLGLKNTEVAWGATKSMQAMQTQMLAEAADISERQVKLQLKNPEMYKLLGVVQDYSTLRRVDPTRVNLNERDAKGKLKYETLKTYWGKLSLEAKQLYEDTRDYYVKNYNLHYDLLNGWITAFDLPGDVSDASTPKGNLIASIRKMQETGRAIDPYFPLMRYGNFWVRIGKGKSGKMYMFESQSDKELFIKTWFREQQAANPNADLNKFREDDVLSDGNDIESARKDMTKYYDVLKNMFDTIDSMKSTGTTDDFGNKRPELDKVNKERLKDSIYQMILHTLPDASFRKQFIHRQGKEGFSGDLARNFMTLSTAMSNQLSRLKYGPVITNAMQAAEAELKGNPEAARLREFVTEMKMRTGREMNPAPENALGHRAANFANQTAFLYMMTNVKTAVAQLLAIPTFTAPVLASRHGTARTAKALGSFAAIWNSVGVRRENADGSTSWVAPTIAQSKRVKLNPEERQAVQYMIDRGLTENTLAYDLGNRKKMPTEVQNSTFRRGARAAINAMTALFHHSERLIREVTFMASFRLNRQKYPDESFEQIAQRAEKETYDALSNFASSNRPRGIGATAEREVLLDAHKPLGRAILQFKMFPAFVTTYFVRNLYRMLGKGYTKEERKEAAVQFFGTILMSFTLAGVMGIPGFSFALGVLSGLRKVMMDDDEDDPLEKRDLMLWFRNIWIPQTFGNITIAGKPLSDVVDRGVIASLTGFDFTGSMSLNNMWFPELKETATAQAAMQDYLISLMGPFASLISKQLPKAIDFFNQGKLLEGMEQLLPAIARSPVTAYRYATEGASTTWGAEIKPANEFTIGQIIGQSTGFSTEGLVARREDLFRANALRIQIQNQKRKLMDRLDLELREDGNVDKVLEDIFKYNAKNWFDPIRPSEIKKSLRTRLERRVTAERGLAVEKKYYPQMMELFDVSGRKLAAEAAK